MELLMKKLTIISIVLSVLVIVGYTRTHGNLVNGFLAGITLAMSVLPEIRNWKWSNSEGAIRIVVRHFRIEKEIIFIYG